MTCGGDRHCRCVPPVIAGESSRASPNGSATCGSDRHYWCAPTIVAGESYGSATGIAGVHLPSWRVSPNGSATCGGGRHCPSSQASLNSSATCGSDQHCRCVPPIVAGESVRLRDVWRQLALLMRASHRRGRVRQRFRDLWRRPAHHSVQTLTLAGARTSPGHSPVQWEHWHRF